jgi:hypothetical protein
MPITSHHGAINESKIQFIIFNKYKINLFKKINQDNKKFLKT